MSSVNFIFSHYSLHLFVLCHECVICTHDVIARFFQFSSGGACCSMLSLWKHALPKVKQTNKETNKNEPVSACKDIDGNVSFTLL